MNFHEFDFNMDSDFDIEKSKRQISEDMQSILKATPEAAPVLEEIAKLLAIAEEPDKYLKSETVTIEGFGKYELIAAPAAGVPGYSVLVKLDLENGKHTIGPAQVWNGKTMEGAVAEMEYLKLYYKGERPTKLTDVISNCTYCEDGYFTPYDTNLPNLGPFAPFLELLNPDNFIDMDTDDEEDIEDD